jgi:hypothetical protein
MSVPVNTPMYTTDYRRRGEWSADRAGERDGRRQRRLFYGNGFPQSVWQDGNYYVDVVFTAAASTPYLTLSFNPPAPSIASDTPLGAVVATITSSWSDGTPFTGRLAFGPPYSNDQGTFAIGNTLIVNPLGPGVSGDANTSQNVTITATQ